MKALCLLVLVAMCQAGPLQTSVARLLTAPLINKVVARDVPTLLFEFSWTEVESSDILDPVVGYKLRVWESNRPWGRVGENGEEVQELVEQPELIVLKTKQPGEEEVAVNGEELQVDMEPAQLVDLNWTEGLQAEILTPAGVTTGTFYNVRIGVIYDVRVAAYTRTTEGPWSNVMRLRMGPD